jgi:hypothetical protein
VGSLEKLVPEESVELMDPQEDKAPRESKERGEEKEDRERLVLVDLPVWITCKPVRSGLSPLQDIS